MVYLKGKKKLFSHPVLKQSYSTESENTITKLSNCAAKRLRHNFVNCILPFLLPMTIRLIITLQLSSPKHSGRPRHGQKLLTRGPDCPALTSKMPV